MLAHDIFTSLSEYIHTLDLHTLVCYQLGTYFLDNQNDYNSDKIHNNLGEIGPSLQSEIEKER